MLRASVTEPPCPMGIRSEHITEFERLLYVVPKYDASSSAEYTIKHDSNDATLFTVTGKKFGDRPVREFRDASGLPLFEVQRPLTWMTWRMQRLWQVRLPGDEGTDLVTVKTRRAGTQFALVFRNAVAKDAKSEEEKLVTVEVCSNAATYWRYDVTVDGRKVVDIRESMERNHTTSILQPYPQRMVLEVLVADGFDLSLVSWNLGSRCPLLTSMIGIVDCPHGERCEVRSGSSGAITSTIIM